MNKEQYSAWESAVDTAESMPMTSNLPKAEEVHAGLYFEDEHDGLRRKWVRVDVIAGAPGSRWAYWAQRSQNDTGPHPEFKVIADVIFNGDQPRFAGMLGVPHAGKFGKQQAWVLLEPRYRPQPLEVVIEQKGERYERSREIYDVDTHEARKI